MEDILDDDVFELVLGVAGSEVSEFFILTFSFLLSISSLNLTSSVSTRVCGVRQTWCLMSSLAVTRVDTRLPGS